MIGLFRPRRPLTWGPWVFVAMFAVVLAANGVMALVAFTSWTGLETGDAYRKGVAYNRTLEAARAQAALGWRVELDVVSQGAGRVRLAATFRDRNGEAPGIHRVTARLVRPTHSGHDRSVVLTRLAAGRYGAETTLSLRGQWEFRVSAEHAGGSYQARRRVVVE